MEVVGVRVELPSNTPIVLLREVDEPQRMLPIFIGGPEATAIALALDDVSTPRPMTHDLMRNMLTEFEMSYERLDITSLADGTFYSEMHLRRGDKALVISSRPSDGIALAIRMGTPIFAARRGPRCRGLRRRRRRRARGRGRAVQGVHRQREPRRFRLLKGSGGTTGGRDR